jgi:nucleotide-binding universal stress UspA family protein
MKPIIVLTDFSPVALNAVKYAADLVSAMNSDLVLMHVCRLPVAYTEVPIIPDTMSALMKEAEDKLSALKTDLASQPGNKINISCEVRTGTVISEAENLADSLSPYAIVMGSYGKDSLERMIFGSNTIDAMKNLTCPLIVVPADGKFKTIRKIGLACDLKRVAETAPVEEIRALVKQFNAELHVIHVNREDEGVYTKEKIAEAGLLQEMLSDMNPVYDFLNNVDIDKGLSDYIEKHDIDMLVIIPKKHGLFGKFFRKSNAKQLLLHTHVPLMSVHE